MNKKGILIVNLGTPDDYRVKSIKKYLKEFLLDKRVIDIPWLMRNILVRLLIIPFRAAKVSKIYKKIWTAGGSPLKVYGLSVEKKLQKKMGDAYHVSLAMRYQNPSIKSALKKFQEKQIDHITILPLFPQYAGATTGSIIEKVMETVQSWPVIPALNFINHFYDFQPMLDIYAEKAKKKMTQDIDFVLFSFHGLPQRQLKKSDFNKKHCLKNEKCCHSIQTENRNCYGAQCYASMHGIAKKMNLAPQEYSICFQSRLGKDPWIEPYTSNMLKKLAKEGKKKILVLCPAFVADCIETIYEIGIEYQEEFKSYGGKEVVLVDSLNDDDAWVLALQQLIIANPKYYL